MTIEQRFALLHDAIDRRHAALCAERRFEEAHALLPMLRVSEQAAAGDVDLHPLPPGCQLNDFARMADARGW